jgi:hypothetical protein
MTDDRDAYVKMKAKEKGIPDSEVQKGGNKSAGGKWNAFREMNKVKVGGTPMLAKIPDGVKIVGAPGGIHQGRERDSGKKRSRDDDEEGGNAKREKVDVSHTRHVVGRTKLIDAGAQDFHPQLQGQGCRVRQVYRSGR